MGSTLGAGAVVAAVVGVVFLLAVTALIEVPAHGWRAAGEDRTHSSVVCAGEVGSLFYGVAFPVLVEHVCCCKFHDEYGVKLLVNGLA